MRDPSTPCMHKCLYAVSAAAQIPTYTGSPSATVLHTGKGRYAPYQPIMGVRPPTMEECDLRKGRNAVLLHDIHLHKGGLTHAHWHLPCQDFPQLCNAATH